jgi:glutathione S-transferase
MARHFARTKDHPTLDAWYHRLAERPAFRASLPGPGDDRLIPEDFYDAWQD